MLPTRAKILERAKARAFAEACRSQGLRLVFSNGCFDLLHPGHLRFLEQARALGGALLVAINMDAEAANEEMTATTYRNPRLLEASEKTLNLIASAATHPHRLEILPDGTKRKLCTRFLTVTCEEHQAVEKAVRKAYFRNAEEMIAPQHLTLRPDGTLIQLKQYQITAKELESLIQEAVQVVGKPRTPNGQTAARKGARKKTR